MNPTLLWKAGSAFVATGIITGAFGAHALSGRLSPDSLASFRTASTYSILNGLGLLVISGHPRFSTHRFAGPSIALGTLLFSGSIFALTLDRNLKFLGPITPLGGMLLISGYISMIF
ncbi:DUF423-domain-containing protein [Mycena chlorophos]|uniref:DUF423-domain-containing protein n=1 Tax=Mycena chlorophos TaxID=658473 RepID=A0A8H6T2Q3_MYCCL|nr:DUF423-domain-containing protein [Mycena chlorophos]